MALLKILKRMSIKWKLSLALIVSGLTLVSAYVIIAKQVFENDKISYVFDSQGSRLESTKSEIESKFERAVLSARSVIATFDLASGKPTAAGEQIFKEETNLLALELWNETKNQSVFRLEKEASVLPPMSAAAATPPIGQLDLMPLMDGKYSMSLRYSQAGEVFRLRAALDMKGLLPRPRATTSIALLQGSNVVAISDLRGIDPKIFGEVAASSADAAASERTRIWSHGDVRFLVSEIGLSTGKMKLAALTPEAEALGALGTLFNRSMIFLLFSMFGLIIVSLALARGLTRGLHILTHSAQEIGTGQFDSLPSIDSQDEMGVLAGAFKKMSQEIKRLLVETREKARMEEELKTASFVQERLLPPKANATVGQIEVSGVVLTSSECGGDWWYYFQQGHDIYIAIADATGHGTPAALITAAARSIFSRLEHEILTLTEMLRAWDFAISSCSQRELMMTGLLFRINTKTGAGAFVNAAHESPFFLRAQADGSFSSEDFDLGPTARLGDNVRKDLEEVPFQLEPNDALILYTDGLFSVERPDGPKFNERRFIKKLVVRAEFARSATELTQATLDEFNRHREGHPFPDDVSVVSIRRQGIPVFSIPANESGERHVST